MLASLFRLNIKWIKLNHYHVYEHFCLSQRFSFSQLIILVLQHPFFIVCFSLTAHIKSLVKKLSRAPDRRSSQQAGEHICLLSHPLSVITCVLKLALSPLAAPSSCRVFPVSGLYLALGFLFVICLLPAFRCYYFTISFMLIKLKLFVQLPASVFCVYYILFLFNFFYFIDSSNFSWSCLTLSTHLTSRGTAVDDGVL